MARQARVRVGGRPQGRSGIDEFLVISSLLAREDLRVGAAPEMHDALFRTNSAVVLPEGEDPAKTQSGTRALTSVGLFSTLLRYNEEHPSHIDASGKEVRKKLLIAGHSDTKGSDQFNQPLSEERAKVTLALLTGGQKGRDDFAKLCMARHDGIDLTQIFHWVADSSDFNFQCKPTRWDQTPSTTTITNFKKAYNAAFDEKFKDMEGAKRFPAENGTQDAALWGAIFDCYEYGLRCELGDMETSTEGTDELKRLRGMLTWVDPNHQSMGFGERFPVDELTKKDVRSQSNRRVEIMMFDEGEEPDLAAAVADPEVMETYLPGAYGKVPVKPMVSARPWRAEWDKTSTWMGEARTLLLRAPGISYGLEIVFTIDAKGFGQVGTMVGASSGEEVSVSFGDWDPVPGTKDAGELAAGTAFPVVEYEGIAEGGGRRIKSRNRVIYKDRLLMKLVVGTGSDDYILANEKYSLVTPWGRRWGKTDADGILEEPGLAPGGASVVLRGRILVSFGEMKQGWHYDA